MFNNGDYEVKKAPTQQELLDKINNFDVFCEFCTMNYNSDSFVWLEHNDEIVRQLVMRDYILNLKYKFPNLLEYKNEINTMIGYDRNNPFVKNISIYYTQRFEQKIRDLYPEALI